MLRRMALVAIGVLVPGMAALADGIPAAEIAARCQVKKTNVTRMAYETQTFTLDTSNEGKACVITESRNTADVGMASKIEPYERMSIATEPAHGQIVFSYDSRSYIQYRPTPGYVGTDSFEYRLLPRNALRTVTVTVGP